MSVLPQINPSAIQDGVFQLSSLGAKVIAIEHSGDLLLVDTGARGSFPLVNWSLNRLGFNADRVRNIALTHAHPDHAGALASFVAHTAATVSVHEEDADVLERHDHAGPLFGRLTGRFTRALSKRMYDGPVTPSTRFVHGAALDWPEPIEVIHTPGHTPGSISLYIPSKKIIVVGDALQHRFKRLGGPARLVTSDYPEALRSLERLAELDFETMVFSHFPTMKRNAKQKLESLITRMGQAKLG
jgi:glyoxylase-like metal-dependent hydrolase (beta-lactamase superfamily II)